MTNTVNRYMLKEFEFTLMQSYAKHLDRDPQKTDTVEYVEANTYHEALSKLPDCDPSDGVFWQITHVGFPQR